MAVPSFLTKNGSTDFLSKQKNLFDILDSAEKEKKNSIVPQKEFMEVDNEILNKRKRKETKQFRRKESLFKEPVDLYVRFKKHYQIPDYQRNPQKWVKYSLADITQDDMSNESNTAAALSFLRELKIQKRQSAVKMEVDEPETKPNPATIHQFKRPIKQEPKMSNEPVIDYDRDTQVKPVFKSSKLIMPEYVVGQAKKENKVVKKKDVKEKVKEVYLNHIHEYEDE